MVRPSPSEVTQRRREELHVRARIDSVVSELVARTSPHGVDISLPPIARTAEGRANKGHAQSRRPGSSSA